MKDIVEILKSSEHRLVMYYLANQKPRKKVLETANQIISKNLKALKKMGKTKKAKERSR